MYLYKKTIVIIILEFLICEIYVSMWIHDTHANEYIFPQISGSSYFS